MDLVQERLDLLTAAREARQRAVMHYQIDIDNFATAIELINSTLDNDQDMLSFASELEDRLASTRHQQAREQIILRAIETQLDAEVDHVD